MTEHQHKKSNDENKTRTTNEQNTLEKEKVSEVGLVSGVPALTMIGGMKGVERLFVLYASLQLFKCTKIVRASVCVKDCA